MSDTPRRRIRAQASAADGDVMGFVLDAPVQAGRSAQFDGAGDAPLSRALFAIEGVTRAEVAEATIWVRKLPAADWAALKPAIAATIRDVLDRTDLPLGAEGLGADLDADPDAALLRAVEELLERQVNPAVASHGGRIAAERVAGGTVYLRMSGGCQGCAASSATLRQGVERMLRAALPQITEIVDVTDHAAGSAPFYARADRPSPLMHRPVPPGVLSVEGGQVRIDPDFLGPRLGMSPEDLREGMRTGDIVGVTETGEGADAGRTRIVLRSPTRAWAAEIDETGAVREIPPPRPAEAAADEERDLTARVRAHLEGLPAAQLPITYGALARALGLWVPGSVGRVTRALEATMREDAAAGRPFIAAHVVGRGREALPGRGFFDLARALSRGPREGESERDFHARELSRLPRLAD
jgi:NFU1 iron-sulfur cluster scaffold homolog, mitochondrial